MSTLPQKSVDEILDSQINVRCATSMRDRVERLSGPNTGKPADVARVFIELGLRAAKQHGYHTILGILERNEKIVFSREVIEALSKPMPDADKTSDRPARVLLSGSAELKTTTRHRAS